ncbi:MAG: sensor histidine kinase [Thermoleophilaceae bacterium]
MDWAFARLEKLTNLDTRTLDYALALVLTVLAQIEIPASAGAAGHAALLLTLAVGIRRRWPLAVAGLTAIAASVQGLADNPPSVFGEYVAITLVTYTVAAHESMWPALAGGLLIVAGIVLHDLPSPEYGSASGIASDLTTPIAAWFVGRAVRTARTRAETARKESTELVEQAVAEERRHIARELHDVVTHSLGLVVLQAQGARRFLDAREPEVGAALEAIEQSGRSSLVEMQRLLGLLREEEDAAPLAPQPRVAALPRLAQRLREAGLDVELAVEGEPRNLEPAIDLSAYRIVQEALTNSVRHGSARSARVVVGYRPHALELEVVDDGRANGSGVTGGGHGLVGMRERAAFFGGHLEHGHVATGGYRVFAHLPFETAE